MHAVSLQQHALKETPLQRLDGRLKLLLLLAYTLAVVTTPITKPIPFGIYSLLLGVGIYAAALSPGALVKRLWVLLPFLATVTLTLPFHQSEEAKHLLFLNYTVKGILGTSAAILLTASTPFPKLVKALEQLRVPRILVVIFSFTYRYLFLLQEEAQRMIRACHSRGYEGRWITDIKILGHLIGSLFIRSYERGERVHLAMVSRGFEGSFPAVAATPFSGKQLFVFALVVLTLSAAWGGARF